MSTNAQEVVPVASAWRQFTFFDVLPVKDIHDLSDSPEIFKKSPEIACITSSNEGPLVADIHGSVYLLSNDFETVKSWVAHTEGRVTHMAVRNGVLITLGEEDAAKHPFLKIWDLRTTDKKTGSPLLLRSAKVQSGNRPHPISTMAVSTSLGYLAIGLADGTVLLYRHLDQFIYSGSSSLTNIPKPRVIHESASEPVTGLGFREATEDSPNLYLYIVTINRILAYQVSGKGSGGAPAEVDEVGCGLGCATVDQYGKNMVVARDEAIYLYGTEGRGACYAYEGHKSFVHSHLNYLVIVSPPLTPSASATSATVRKFAAKNDSTSDVVKVVLFDLENKLVAYSGTHTEGMRMVFSVGRQVYLLPTDGKLLHLEEIPTSSKLELLYRKSLYTLALDLAKTQHLDDASVADIHKRYGDHLYAKGEFDNAMVQFVQTVGHVQPSYVIRKFLDAQRIQNLVTYLQELHSLGLANADHTTLLLNAYTKLKDVGRLDTFIKAESHRSATDGEKEELPFDLDTAIRVCRQAGYYDHACYLAEKYARHEDYLQIQVEDTGNYKEALSYLRKLGATAAESNLARYGRALLSNLPSETTELLIDICTSLTSLNGDNADHRPPPSRQASNSGPSYLSYLALNRSAPTNEPVLSSSASATTTVKPSEIPSRRGTSVASDFDTQPSRSETPTIHQPSREQVKLPSPRIYFAHFVDHREQFVHFLETVAARRWGQSIEPTNGLPMIASPDIQQEDDAQDQAAVWNTLLELYLSTNGSGQDKAMRVLKSDFAPYDLDHALIVCSSQQFTPGLVYLWERMRLFEHVLRFYMDKHKQDPASNASAEVVQALDRYGTDSASLQERRQLYPLVLRFLTSTPELLSKHTADLERIMEFIEDNNIMPPLTVVQVLSRNGVASVGLVKKWLMSRIQAARVEIDTDQTLISSYRTETAAKLRQVEELSDTDHAKVFHVTQCAACGGQLDLPSIHFMCNHSYHQRCLGDHDTECRKCARDHSMIREIRRNNARLADQHDVFLSEVKEGGFAAVAAGFGRGIINVARLDDVGP